MRVFRDLIEDTRAADTIPLKMVVYLSITGVIMVLVAVSWNNSLPFIQGVEADEQMTDAALKLQSIQEGSARSLIYPETAQGSMCNIEFSLPEDIIYVAFGVDPDPDGDGDLTNSEWVQNNNTITYQYNNGVRKHVLMKGDTIDLKKGIQDEDGIWVIDGTYHEKGIVIEGPVNGEFGFELVLDGNVCTLSHF